MSTLFPAPFSTTCNLKLPAGIPSRASPPCGGTGFQPMAPADKHREKRATVRKNFGEQLLETASDKEGTVRQMERNSALPHPRAPSELWEQPSRHRIPALKSNGPGGSAGMAPSPGSGTSRPRPGVQPRAAASAASPAFWPRALGFSSSREKKKRKRKGKKGEKKETRHGSYLFSQAAAAEHSLTYFFSSPPFILTYFGAAAAAASRTRRALPSAHHSRRSSPKALL